MKQQSLCFSGSYLQRRGKSRTRQTRRYTEYQPDAPRRRGRAGRLAVPWAGGEEGGQKASGWRPLSRGPEEESEWAVPMGAGHCFVAVTVLFSSRIYIYIFFRIICASLLILSI